MKSDSDDNKICPKCQMPLEKKGSGSLTQWIKVCNCGRPDAEKVVGAPINICTTCGKRIEAGRAGTLTQWIFRTDLCTCKAPTWVREQAQAATDAIPVETVDELDDVEELPMEPGSFPVERYGPIRRVGMGASGTVYLARDRLLNKKVAVKVLNYLSSEQLVSFQREAKTTSQIEHANIVKVLDFGVCDGKFPYMVLEYINGLSLEKVLEEKQTLDLEEALPIFNQVCDGLSFAHSHNLFHRDLKPPNIIVAGWRTKDISVRLIDFGVGTIRQDTTAQGLTVSGSPAYMSPDQALGLRFDERSEVYSFGCVMYEVLTGRPPFQGETALETISLHAHAEPLSLSDAHGEMIFPDAVESVIATCLSKSPNERYNDMAEVKKALIELSDRSTDDRRVDTPLSPRQSSRWKQFTVWAIVALVVCTVSGAILVQIKWLGDGDARKNAPRKIAYQEPKLSDALDSMESDTWYKGANGDGQLVWNSKPNLTDEDVKLLLKESDVKRIFVGVTDSVTGMGFKYLLDRGIEEISVDSTGLTDEGLCQISKMKTLETLRITLSSGLSLEGIKCITTLPELSTLNLTVMKIPDGALEEISKIRTLESLSMYNSKNVNLAGIKSLGALHKLSYLDISGTKLHNDIIPVIAKFKALTQLRLSDLDLNDDNLEYLSRLPKMDELWLNENPKITDQGLMKLENCNHLKVLVLQRCNRITILGKTKFTRHHPQVRLRVISDTGSELHDSMKSLSGE